MVGRGHRSELLVIFVFVFFMVFCSLDKTSRKQKKIDPWTGSGERPGRGHGSELFGSFGFSMFFLQFGLGGAGVQIVETRIFWEVLWWKHLHMKNMQKKHGKTKKRKKKKKSSDPWTGSGERPGRGHGSELFVFFCFSMVFCSLAKTSRKQNKKVQTHGQGLGRGLAGDMGLNFLFFVVFFGFSIVFLHVFHVKMLLSQYLSKNARFYNLHTCAPHEDPFCYQNHHLYFHHLHNHHQKHRHPHHHHHHHHHHHCHRLRPCSSASSSLSSSTSSSSSFSS